MRTRNNVETISFHNSARQFTNTDLQEMQEFQILIFNMMKGLTVSVQEIKEEIETLRKNQKEAWNEMIESINEMKTARERNSGRLNEMENRISMLEDSSFQT